MAPKALAGSSGLLLFAIWMLVTALAVVAGSERNGGEMELPFQGELQELELPLVRESTTDGSAADSKAKDMEETRKEKSSRKIMTWGGDQCGQCDLNCKRCQCRNCSCVCQKCKRGYLLNGNQCLEVVSTLPPSPNDGGFIVGVVEDLLEPLEAGLSPGLTRIGFLHCLAEPIVQRIIS